MSTGKFAVLKPMTTYLGVVAEVSSGARSRLYPIVDQEVTLYLLKCHAGSKSYLQLRDFLIWVNDEVLPVISKGQASPAISSSLKELERQGSVKLDDPADFLEKVILPDSRKVSRVVIA